MSETYKKITYDSKKVQVESAIRDGNGVKIDTNYQRKPQVINYTIPNTVSAGYKKFASYSTTYDGSPGYLRFRLECTSAEYMTSAVFEITWAGYSGSASLLSSNCESSDIYEICLLTPYSEDFATKSPTMAIYNNRAAAKDVKITILESSEDVIFESNWNTVISISGWHSTSALLGTWGAYMSMGYVGTASYATSATSATYLKPSSSTATTISTNHGVQFTTSAVSILSTAGPWCIETYKGTATPTLIMQRAINMNDPSNVCIRTSVDNGATWAGWTYSYAVWKV